MVLIIKSKFFQGFLLASVGCLLIDSFGSIIAYVTELAKAKINVKIVEYNSEVAKISKDLDDSPKPAVIGF